MLINGIIKGDTLTLKNFYKDTMVYIQRYILENSGNTEDVEDVFQDLSTRLLDVIGGTGGDVAEHQALSDGAAKHARDLVLELRLGLQVAVLHGQTHGVAESHTAADDADLHDRVALGQDPLHHRVTTFVVGDGFLLGIGQHH